MSWGLPLVKTWLTHTAEYTALEHGAMMSVIVSLVTITFMAICYFIILTNKIQLHITIHIVHFKRIIKMLIFQQRYVLHELVVTLYHLFNMHFAILSARS